MLHKLKPTLAAQSIQKLGEHILNIILNESLHLILFFNCMQKNNITSYKLLCLLLIIFLLFWSFKKVQHVGLDDFIK